MSLSQLSQLLPFPDEDLRQILTYASTLSKNEAASHLGDLLGDSPLAVDFISSFNSSRKEPVKQPQSQPEQSSSSTGIASAVGTQARASDSDGVPRAGRYQKKKKPAIHTPQARRVEEFLHPAGATYSKKESNLDYIAQRPSAPTSGHASRSTTPKPSQTPPQQPAASTSSSAKAPSAGYLVSDLAASKSKTKSQPGSRPTTPKPTSTKISVTGGTPMAGQSTAIADLDSAIRALEVTTNPSLSDNPKSRRCNCVATRHPLQSAAPNCLSCGKVICMREGLGPCTFCGASLLSSDDVQTLIRQLKEERGKERMAANAGSNRRADVSKTPLPFHSARENPLPSASSASVSLSEAAIQAREHRDKLLNFQAENAQRTTVRDEAADFDVAPSRGGVSMRANPEERAKELRRQQKLMREMEWNARPEWEKRTQVLSIDIAGRKVVRKMVETQRPQSPDEEAASARAGSHDVLGETTGNRGAQDGRTGGGAFSHNPLLGALIKPVFELKGKEAEKEGRRDRKKGWRRVQDDLDNNEDVILDGGVYGHGGRSDEPDCG